MFRNAKFSDAVEDIIIDVSYKFYNSSNVAMSDLEFSRLSGIETDILEWYYSWCILDDGIYFYKNNDLFNELFTSELALECMVKCVSFKVARDTSIRRLSDIGIISKLYRKSDKEYLMYGDFCKKYFNQSIDDLSLFREKSIFCFGDENTDKLMMEIFKLITFDIFSGQWDRGEHNFFFECGKDSVSVAPLCDNGMVFSNDLNYFSPFGNFSLSMDNCYDYNTLFNIIRKEEGISDCFRVLLNIDIKKVLERTCDKYRILLENCDKDCVVSYFDGRKKEIDSILRRVKKM